MRGVLLILAVGSGGAIGAVLRHLLGLLLHGVMGMSEYVGIMIINILGCFLIGVAFFFIEARYNRDVGSRLAALPLAAPLRRRGWWPEEDPTMPLVREFKSDLFAQFWSGFLITGILGGMTTFSLFSLMSLRLLESGAHLGLVVNMAGTIVLGCLATWLGLVLARRIFLLSGGASRAD